MAMAPSIQNFLKNIQKKSCSFAMTKICKMMFFHIGEESFNIVNKLYAFIFAFHTSNVFVS